MEGLIDLIAFLSAAGCVIVSCDERNKFKKNNSKGPYWVIPEWLAVVMAIIAGFISMELPMLISIIIIFVCVGTLVHLKK